MTQGESGAADWRLADQVTLGEGVCGGTLCPDFFSCLDFKQEGDRWEPARGDWTHAPFYNMN